MKSRLRPLTILVLAALSAILIFQIYLHRTQESVTDTAESETPQTTLRVVVWDYEQSSYLQSLFTQFEEKNPDISLKVISYDQPYYSDALNTMLLNNEPVDIFFLDDPNQLTDIALQSQTMPLDSLLRIEKLDPARYGDILDTLRHPITQELMALPFRIDKYVLFYNRTLLDEMHADLPFSSMTPTTFLSYLENIRQQSNSEDPLCLIPYHPRDTFLLFNGADFAVCENPSARLKDSLELFHQLQTTGLIYDWTKCDMAELSENAFTLGSVPLMLANSSFIDQLRDMPLDFHFDIVPVPHNPSLSPVLFPTSISIHKNCQNKDTAWRFLHFLCGPEGSWFLTLNHIVPGYQDTRITSQLIRSAPIDSELYYRLPRKSDASVCFCTYFNKSDYQQLLDTYARNLLGLCPDEQVLQLFTELLEDKSSPNYFEE